MTVKLDVTGDKFDIVDMDCCDLWLQLPRKLEDKLLIEFRNLVLHTTSCTFNLTGQVEKLDFDPSKHNIILQGISVLTIEYPSKVEIDVSLYSSSDATKGWLEKENGDVAHLSQTMTCFHNYIEAHKYDLGGRLLWPHGDCSLTVHAAGSLSIEFDCVGCRRGGNDKIY